MDHPLTIVTGRRRIGKSRLIQEFLEGKNALFFEADMETGPMILHNFSEKVSEVVGSRLGDFRNWRDAIQAFIELAPVGRKVLAIDEFQYIASADVNFTKQFQGIWDSYLSQQDVMVILCGSYFNMMRKLTVEYSAPLFGRNTGDLRMIPIPFRSVPHSGDYRRAVEEYAFTGGVPHYMMMMDSKKSVMGNIEHLVMSPGSPLLVEPAYLLSDEFRDPSSYNTYLRVIAEGNRKMDRITSAVQAPSSSVSPYLNRLISVGILERRVPATEREDGHARNGLYVITDYFIAFWFRFIFHYRNTIARGMPDLAISELHAHFIDSHVSFVFEDICRTELMHHLRLKGVYAAYGSYWEGNIEIDVVAVDPMNHVIYAGECKFRSTPIGADVLRSLRVKCQKVRPFEGYMVVHCVFSVSGYTDEAVEDSKCDGSVLFDCGEPVVGSL